MKARFGIGALPFAQFLNDVLHFADLVLGAFARVDVGNVQDGFLVGVEHLHDGVGSWGIAKVPLGFDLPIGSKAKLAERRIMEAGTDRFLWDDDDRLLEFLVL